MLVLTRREDQTITFPELGITLQILRVGGQQVRIGIDAPRDVRVLRGELTEEQALEPHAFPPKKLGPEFVL